MKTLYNTIFAETASAFSVTLTHDENVFTSRTNLIDSGTGYYYRRTLTGVSDASFTETKDFPFTIDFIDTCRTATIVDQTITFPQV